MNKPKKRTLPPPAAARRTVPPPSRGSGMRRAVAPTGKCWCGCGEATAAEAFFLPGHDRMAEGNMVKQEYGSLAEMLAAHGYVEGGVKRRKRKAS